MTRILLVRLHISSVDARDEECDRCRARERDIREVIPGQHLGLDQELQLSALRDHRHLIVPSLQ